MILTMQQTILFIDYRNIKGGCTIINNIINILLIAIIICVGTYKLIFIKKGSKWIYALLLLFALLKVIYNLRYFNHL